MVAEVKDYFSRFSRSWRYALVVDYPPLVLSPPVPSCPNKRQEDMSVYRMFVLDGALLMDDSACGDGHGE